IERARLVLGEDAQARRVLQAEMDRAVIVILVRTLGLFGRKIGAEIAIEAAARTAGHPLEAPAHAFLERLELFERRARHRGEIGVAGIEMHDGALEIVRPERAALAGGVPIGVEHQVIDDELRAAAEEIREPYLALGTGEAVVLDSLPR